MNGNDDVVKVSRYVGIIICYQAKTELAREQRWRAAFRICEDVEYGKQPVKGTLKQTIYTLGNGHHFERLHARQALLKFLYKNRKGCL
jgi:hypothetical protein